MVIAKIQGGLGNQMFQYAFGRMLALRNNCELKLDITMFPTYKYHLYTMDKLNISAPVATDEEIAFFAKKRPRQGRKNFLYNLLLSDPSKYVVEPTHYFTPSMMNLRAPCMVDGYWLTEKYFLEIEDILRKEFSIRPPLNEYTKRMEEKILQAPNPVMLHVRRMDFAHDKIMRVKHGTTSPEYYKKALGIMRERVAEQSYFIFSDEPEWARANIRPEAPAEYIGQGPEVNYFDLYLMSLCKHFILANSTFGWWGAWLSQSYRHNTTIIPKHMTQKMDTRDLACPGWTVLAD